jgi:hypothetical protein
MKIYLLILAACITSPALITAQSLAINSTGAIANASAILDVSSANKGLLIPRVSLVSTTDVTTIVSPAPGLLVYNTNPLISGLGAAGTGFYYYIGTWYKLLANDGSNTVWFTGGNGGTVDNVNYIGTYDFVPLNFRAFNKRAGRVDPTNENAFFGSEAGGNNAALYNTALGHWALKLNTSGNYNTAVGDGSLLNNLSGVRNTATGHLSLYLSSNGDYNTADGAFALYSSISGVGNTGIGFGALYNSTGDANTAIGWNALHDNTKDENTAVGANALSKNSTGRFNTATGAGSLSNNLAANNNTANGYYSLTGNTSGSNNTAMGTSALYTNSSGSFNTAFGTEALYTNNNDNNTAMGYQGLYKNISGNNNVAIGSIALYANMFGSENTGIGASSLNKNLSGNQNAALGTTSLFKNTSGNNNLAAGYATLSENIDGNNNTAVGYKALSKFNTTGSGNTAIGSNALATIFSGNYTTTIGTNSTVAEGLTNATAIGAYSKADQSNSLVLGSISGTNGATANTNVGIGTTTPNAPLQFGNDFASRKIVMTDYSNNDNEFTGFGIDPNALRYQVWTSVIDHVFYSGINSSSSKELMRITGTGKIGIGNSSPPNALTINYTGTVAATTSSYALAIQQSGSTDITLGSNSNAYLQTWNSKPLLINSQGNNVGIGVNTIPSAKLDINGALLVESAQTTHVQGAWLEWNKDGGSGRSYFLNQKGLGSGGFVFGEVDNANVITQRFIIDNVGNASFFGSVSASCGTLICSDIRYKKDIAPLQNSLSKIMLLNPVSYYFKKDEFKNKNFTDNKQVGLIAQELENIYPELVQTDAQGYKSIDYAKLTPILADAIKELKTQNNALVEDNAQLKILLQKLDSKVVAIEKMLITNK